MAEKPKAKNYYPETHRRWYLKNAEKKKAYARAWAASHPERVLKNSRDRKIKNPRGWVESHRKRLYGISSAEVNALLEKQNGRCGICGLVLDGDSKVSTPHIDHCHETKIVRGLLCSTCNVSLGHIERPGFLGAALSYLGRSK